jgi:hypothetical protein
MATSQCLFLIGKFKKIFSENALPNESKLGRKHPWKVIYKECIFSCHPLISRFIWPSIFRGEDFFRNQPIRNKKCLWWPCLLRDRK